jgi:hypothetical protein
MHINKVKHVKLKMRECKLRGDVYWQGVLKGKKQGLHV